jgi:hypothetical protein
MSKIFKMLVNEVEKGKVVRVPESMFYWFLECLPPLAMNGNAYLNSEPHHHNRQGKGVYWMGFKHGKFYYGCHATVQQYKDREPLTRI